MIIAISAIAVVAALVTAKVYSDHFGRFPVSPKWTDWGVFGDFFGGTLNPVFAFLTLIAVLLALRIQQEEMEKSAGALKTQVDLMVRQSFENMLFQLLNLHHGVVGNLQGPDLHTGLPVKGRDAIKVGRQYLRRCLVNVGGVSGDRRFAIRSAFRRFMDERGPAMGHYFESVRSLFRLTAESDPAIRAKYVAIVVVQLSTDELFLLFFLALADHNDELKEILEQFGVLERLPLKFDEYPEFAYDIPLYRSSAFGDRAPDVQRLYGPGV